MIALLAAIGLAARPTMDQMIGKNGFINDPIDKLSAVSGTLREYHLWAWDAGDGSATYVPYPNNRMRWEPSDAAGGHGWFFDQFYGALAKRGVTVVPCLMESPRWLTPGSEDRPVPAAADPTLPTSYSAHADYLFQFAARYGRQVVPQSRLKLGADQPQKSGLGLIRYLENWNEPNKNWRGKLAEFSPDQFAAMCSADYDGDQGRMGPGFGVKSADPSMKLVMGGLVGVNIPFIEGMRKWSISHRGGSLPFDVINVHAYCNDTKVGEGLGTTGTSPEAGDLLGRLSALAQWRDKYASKCEVWLSEFGYDVNDKSIQRAPGIGARSAEWIQAAWISRTYLIAAAAGMDRAMQYMFRDHNSSDPLQYASSGLVTVKGEWHPRLSYRTTEALRKLLAGCRPDGIIEHPSPDVSVLKFKTSEGKAPVTTVAWANTSRDASITLPRKGFPAFTRATLLDGAPVTLTEDYVTVTEMPVVLR